MGMDVSASVFYGLVFETDTDDAYKFEYDESDDQPEPEEGSPAHLAFWGSGTSKSPVSHTWFGAYEYRGHGIYVGRKFNSGDWSAGEIEPTELTPPPDADEVLRAYCEKWGLTYSKPKWWVAPKYA